MLERIDWSQLSRESQLTIRTIGSLVEDGLTFAEIARRLGKSRPWVSARLRALKQELEEQIEGGQRDGGA